MIINCSKEPSIVPISRGGTGATTVSDARNSIFESEFLPIEYGGTGANNASNALVNLGVNDHIVERGTSGKWTYEKYADGTVKMWYKGTYNSAFDNGNYFGAYRGSSQTVGFPFTLNSVTYAHVDHVAPNTGYCLISALTTSQIVIYPYNRTNQKAVQNAIPLMIEIVGTWK